jgi:predicted AAA+ superfamily ATPase
MESADILPLINAYHRRLASTTLLFKRYLFNTINWNVRLIGIMGARGAGKTTLLLQHIKETFKNPDDTLWVSLDNLWFQNHSLLELVDYLYTHGMTTIFFDEVHKYPNWIQFIKNLYDSYPDLNIVYTGSSMLEIDNSKTDLSRRQSLYMLPVMSFREYLAFIDVLHLQPLKLEDLLENHVSIAMDIVQQTKILKHFHDYLEHGCYPFFKEAGADYLMRLAATAQLVIDTDMPAVEKVTYATLEKTKKLLGIIAQSVPLVPNISKLGSALESTRDSTIRMIYTLDKAQILMLLTRELKSYKHLVAPEKIYLNNTNLMAAFSTPVNEGNMRETFFMNQVQQVGTVQMPKNGDFLVNGKYLFEVGGPYKTFEQIKDEPDSYLVIDNIEMGTGNRIPLWLFGLLY